MCSSSQIGKRSRIGHPLLLFGLGVLANLPLQAQDASGYKTPPKALADLVTAVPTPGVAISSKGDYLLIMDRAANPTIAELSQPELRLAGLRMNPANNGPSRATYLTNLKLKPIPAGAEKAISGLPSPAQISYVQWSPDETKIAFTNSTDSRIELYVIDVATASARKLSDLALNAVLGTPYRWLSDSKTLIVKAIPAERGAAPAVSRVPSGPTVQENLGKKAQAATYQDLLKNPSDEQQFAYYATAQAMRLGLDGSVQKLGEPGLIASAEPSPDGSYVMLETIHKPFSYLVPVNSFPVRTAIFDAKGALVKTLNDAPLQENIAWASDGAPTGPRNFEWRPDVPAAVYYTVAQDNGDPKQKADIRDRVYQLEAPFATPKEIYASTYRFGGFDWGTETVAFVHERWRQTRKSLTKIYNPKTGESTVLFDRSSEDRYGNPGQPDTRRNQFGREVLNILPNNEIMMVNSVGSSPEGDRPFVSVLNLNTKQTRQLWRSGGAGADATVFEQPVTVLDAAKGLILTTRETPEENPNYFIRNLKPAKKQPVLTQITAFPHPYPQLKGIQKQQLRYKRSDGVDLTATLYLPAGYKKEDGPLPTFMWAYPAEFKSKDAAGQVSGSPYRFNRIAVSGAAIFATMGYAVLDNASIPIIGEGDKEPNDTYVEQLVASAKAAIDEGVRLGVVDPTKVGVGGHSYGAFMTANLLTHSNLFRAGIARSGAYNRTLTPFGFQNEQRTYWQAPDVYNRMSPFMNADKMKTPLLLIHGEADNNTGTFPIQSERYYNALKGFGATTKLVFLPYESHGYAAQESLMHMLHEMNGWLDKYVKNAPALQAGKQQPGKAGGGDK
ncbi:S9 family peptidase [Arsenicibacter rosenii]|uniref:S9 family peptidase n=1 Tax=Arsenicibacter rosenii TaxID=1750698 RepID=A0A1S2VPH8_9BACT|nr:prolyl oligopeptidase family serine peptidase [Arsenicibacter rosenii]OIN59698.1 S9 family peptidase [Arsenicibacter rosenii]